MRIPEINQDLTDKQCFQSYEEAISFLHKAIDYEKLISYQYNASTFSLDRMYKMLEFVDNPHRSFPCIHITGTKGKGSTAIMAATILEHMGFTTGLFTSPHLIDLRERIQINHQKISKESFTQVLNKFRLYIQHLRDTAPAASPTFFETITAVCFLYFQERHIDIAVLEVGLGGRLDSTNVVIPQVSVITNIGFDHMRILGPTLSDIAFEKAGIIKQGIPVVSAVEGYEALSVIEKKCAEKGAPLYLLGRDFWTEDIQSAEKNGKKGQICRIKTRHNTYENIFLPLIGFHQAKNCALAIAALEISQKASGLSWNKEMICNALSRVQCPGKMEIIGKDPYVVLDYAHTADSMRSLKKTLSEGFLHNRLILILGFSEDKDIKNILKEIVFDADIIIVTRSNNPRAADPDDLYKIIYTLCAKRAIVERDVIHAMNHARHIATQDDLICITGSSYIVGEVK